MRSSFTGTVLVTLLAVAATNASRPAGASESSKSNLARSVFETSGPAVFRVNGRSGTGSGFLVTSSGLIVTNSHVIGGAFEVTVTVAEGLRVPAFVVEDDAVADISVLAVNPKAVENIPPLKFKQSSDAEPVAEVGDRAYAIGFPLSQDRVITSGIVSRVEPQALIIDVNINPGNSGGPLLNTDSQVIGINTFADFRNTGGAGIGGTVTTIAAEAALKRAIETDFESPEFTRLPTVPKDDFPNQPRGWVADQDFDANHYQLSWKCSTTTKKRRNRRRQGPLRPAVATIATPISAYRPQHARAKELKERRERREQRVAKNRKKRGEATTRRAAPDPFAGLKWDWKKYITSDRDPTVGLVLVPRLDPTAGSVAATLLIGTPTTAWEWRSDLDDAKFLRGDEELPVYLLVVSPLPWTQYNGAPIVDSASYIYMSIPSSHFELPPPGQRPPQLRITIDDLKGSPTACSYVFSPRAVERIWLDFEPYRDHLEGKTAALRLPRQEGW